MIQIQYIIHIMRIIHNTESEDARIISPPRNNRYRHIVSPYPRRPITTAVNDTTFQISDQSCGPADDHRHRALSDLHLLLLTLIVGISSKSELTTTYNELRPFIYLYLCTVWVDERDEVLR